MKSALDVMRPSPCHLFVRLLITALFLIVFALPGPCRAQGQATEDFETLRQRAQQLYDEHRLVEAMPLFEKIVAMKPESSVYHERLGFCILGYAGTLTDREAERKQRVRARQELLRSKELGGKSNLLLVLLEGLPEDGGRNEFSSRKEVDEAIREGEAAFGRGDMDAAAKAYRRALVLDPKSYEAALFLGDVYFKQQKWDAAGEWFAAAVQINPDIETAHRYWGDALMNAGKQTEARARFIEAVIAAPYARASWVGIVQWAQRQNLTLTHPRIASPNAMTDKEGKTNITIDSDSLNAKDGRQHWMLYEMSRQAWKVATFKEKFPSEKEYRHTLQEEAESLGMVAQFVAEDVKKKKIKQLDPALASLLKLHEAGLIEAFVLLAKPDAGIAKDYEAYRKENREKLRKYLEEWVVPKAN
jgi:tetratricopeptide (TPR) repeat protein